MLIDFLIGLITVLLIITVIPFLIFVFHVSIMIAIPIAIAIGIFFGLVVVGRLIRYLFKKNSEK
ncbi:MAG: hypothetical protein KJN62_07250 [Deltaproteobacteria bacterium]|nr:hypothetical protein [Deltaproteobacteria bacterium]